jgi:Fe-S-cluster containining protein
MKHVDSKQLENLPGVRLQEDDTFRFECRSDLACFNRCCRNLNLFLYPYDVVRLKSRLGLRSDRFLDRYVDIVLRPSSFFPDVLLRMADNTEKTCPYLTDQGCSVYPDRPDTCRTFPVEQGALYNETTRQTKRVHFFRPPDFCLGQHEKREWTPKTWAADQDATLYNQMTLQWAEVKRLFQNDPWGLEGPDGRKAKMAFMATYNMDQFREFVFQSSFLKRYKVKTALCKKIANDEVELLKFGFKWVKFYLWGIKSKAIRVR